MMRTQRRLAIPSLPLVLGAVLLFLCSQAAHASATRGGVRGSPGRDQTTTDNTKPPLSSYSAASTGPYNPVLEWGDVSTPESEEVALPVTANAPDSTTKPTPNHANNAAPEESWPVITETPPMLTPGGAEDTSEEVGVPPRTKPPVTIPAPTSAATRAPTPAPVTTPVGGENSRPVWTAITGFFQGLTQRLTGGDGVF